MLECEMCPIKMFFLSMLKEPHGKVSAHYRHWELGVCVLLLKVHNAVGKFGRGRFGEESELGIGTN